MLSILDTAFICCHIEYKIIRKIIRNNQSQLTKIGIYYDWIFLPQILIFKSLLRKNILSKIEALICVVL